MVRPLEGFVDDETQASAGGDAPTGTTAGGEAPPADKGEAAKELEKLQKKLEAVLADNAKYREEKRASKAAADDALRKAGEFEPLLAERDKRIAELEADIEALTP